MELCVFTSVPQASFPHVCVIPLFVLFVPCARGHAPRAVHSCGLVQLVYIVSYELRWMGFTRVSSLTSICNVLTQRGLFYHEASFIIEQSQTYLNMKH